jgi:LmbE family N-acetylglucosaminyl deacetylase
MSLAPGRVVVVSPHLDDAVLSGFGLLTEASSATVITVFAGIPDDSESPGEYDRLTRSDSPRTRMHARREEDVRVLGGLGIGHIHLDFLDHPYRPTDSQPADLARAIAAVLPDHDTLVIPAAIGAHPDHVLAREAALLLPCLGVRLAMADLPYAAVFGWPAAVTGQPDPPFLDPSAAWAPALKRLAESSGRTPELIVDRLSPSAQRRKLAAVHGYRTQFDAQEAGPSRGMSHPRRRGHEVAWRL